MSILNNLPLIGAIIGLLLAGVVMASIPSSKNIKARVVLLIIVLMNVHNLFESYLYYNDYSFEWLGLSYLHYHLIGVMFLIFTHLLFKIAFNLKLWSIVIVVYTLLRATVVLSMADAYDEPQAYTFELFGLIIDYVVSLILNISLLVFAYLQVTRFNFSVALTRQEIINYKWLKNLLLISITIYAVIFVGAIVSFIDEEEWLLYDKIEASLIGAISLGIIYSAIRFPVFASFGDFEDLKPIPEKKYAKSTLTDTSADTIWSKIQTLMNEGKKYTNAEYRLNDLADDLEESVHHVSQVINEKSGKSYFDFINSFRVDAAKGLLLSGRAKEVTILAIALESGFNSKTAFYNTFKKYTGKTPSEFKADNIKSA